jgi:acyl-CoA hydrolase
MILTASEAVERIQSGDHVFVHSAAAAPRLLVEAMSQRHASLRGVSIYQIHTEGPAPYCAPEMAEAFRVKALFVGDSTREAIRRGQGSYIPIFLSEASALFRKRLIPIDVALISVSPPDRHGYCSLGPSVDISLAAAQSARLVIAQVNACMPRTHGDGLLHVRDIDIQVMGDVPLPEVRMGGTTPEIEAVGRHVASLVEDGATLQMGIGAIPNAVLACLEGHKDLGVHSEMFSDGILPLVEKGVINGRRKKKHPGMVVGAFAVGTQRLYDFLDDNPTVQMLDFEYVNKTDVIRRNPKVAAINSAIEIDLTGQVCADSLGSRIYSGVGGQMDFIRAASLSEGGKPIIALTSATKGGQSKIVPLLRQGAGVVTTRAHVHYVATEHGIAYLHGKSLEERARLLIGIAHPAHREALERASRELLG